MPLQGLFNLLIYLQPKVLAAKRRRGREVSWCQACAEAFRSSLGGKAYILKKKQQEAKERDARARTPEGGGEFAQARAPVGASNTTATGASTIAATSTIPGSTNSSTWRTTDAEEGKMEIQPYDDGDVEMSSTYLPMGVAVAASENAQDTATS